VSRDPFHFKANERDRADELSHNTNQNLKAHKNEAKYVVGFRKFKIIVLNQIDYFRDINKSPKWRKNVLADKSEKSQIDGALNFAGLVLLFVVQLSRPLQIIFVPILIRNQFFLPNIFIV